VIVGNNKKICNQFCLSSVGTYVRYYCVALAICFLALLVLALHPTSRVSLTVPDGAHLDNPFQGSDTMTYVVPAKTFLESGEFLRQGKPDIHRTIGYPFFIASMMFVFGKHWPAALLIIQVFFFAALFPATVLIREIWFAGQKKCTGIIMMLLFACGLGTAYVGQMLTDQLFSTLFLLGFALGLLALVRGSWFLLVLHLVLLSFTAQLRPTLAIFWLAELLLMIYTAKLWNISIKGRAVQMITFSVLVLALTGNAPAIRNYINHGIFTPSDVFADGLSTYLARPVKISVGGQEEYTIIADSIANLDDQHKMLAKKKFALETIEQYPIATIKRVSYHVYWNLFEPHWEYIAFVYNTGFSLNSMVDDKGNIKKKLLFSLPFFIFYLIIYFFVFLALLRKIGEKEWCLLAGLIVLGASLAASFITGQGARMRLYIEPILVCFAVCEMRFLLFQRSCLIKK